eukprot:901862-Amphidinium_carterae.2
MRRDLQRSTATRRRPKGQIAPPPLTKAVHVGCKCRTEDAAGRASPDRDQGNCCELSMGLFGWVVDLAGAKAALHSDGARAYGTQCLDRAWRSAADHVLYCSKRSDYIPHVRITFKRKEIKEEGESKHTFGVEVNFPHQIAHTCTPHAHNFASYGRCE